MNPSINKKHILVIGAVLSGTLLAIRLAQLGHKVSLFESRPDMRKVDISAGRSINLALSDRGFRALRMIGIDEEVSNSCIPMHGRMIHPLGGEPFFSPYSGREDRYINSMSREGLNTALLNKADSFDNLNVTFNASCENVDLQNLKATFRNNQTGEGFEWQADYIFGTDGAGSKVRDSFYRNSHKLRFTFSQTYLSHSYKELVIPPTESGGFRIEKNALHIWPRGGFMLIALPNLDGSFTVTLFLAHEGENSFEQLETQDKVISFFKEQFPDTLEHMPTLAEDFFENPTGLLATIKCSPWNAGNNVLLMGDAAHAIVPFYGQGMNASFEDVVVFDELLQYTRGDLDTAILGYTEVRKVDGDAIADLAIDNFYEMRDHVANPVFQRKRKLEMQLELEFPDYFSKYSLVTFNEMIPYSKAMERGRKQDELLLEVCREIEDVNRVDKKDLLKKLMEIK